MKSVRNKLLMVSILITVAVGARFGSNLSRAQTSDSKKTGDNSVQPLVKSTSSIREPNTTTPRNLAAFTPAAIRNAELGRGLQWTFGGKRQTGWYLYRALIGRLLATDADPSSEDFAIALSHWQAKSGLTANGILDEDSINAMVAQWQDARLKDRSFAQPEQLVTAPISEFYDPTRPDELRQVERETYAAYQRMLKAATHDPSLGLVRTEDGKLAPTEKYLKLLSTFRTREYQEKLRRDSPGAGRAGLAINSPHFTGRAIDVYVGGDPVETKDFNRAIQVDTAVYKWLVRNAERFGFHPYFYEPWHWEYVR